MRITHPQTAYRNIPPEDMFFVTDDRQTQLGSGYLIPFVQRELYPAQPLNIYMEISAQPSARSLLFGALSARAEVVRARYPDMRARLYTQLDAADAEMQAFYQRSGFQMDDAEDLYYFPLPYSLPAQLPMGVQYASVPLENREGRPVSELLSAGTGMNASLMQVYTRSEFRHQGMARQLVWQSASILRERGMSGMYAHVFRRNNPQIGLMKSLGATYAKMIAVLPGQELT